MGNIVLTHYDPLELRGTHGHPIFRQTHPRLGGFCNGYRVIISSWGLSKNAGYRTISMFLLQEIDDNKLVFNGIMITGASLSNSGIEVIFDIYRFKCTSTYDLVPFLDLVYIYISILYPTQLCIYIYPCGQLPPSQTCSYRLKSVLSVLPLPIGSGHSCDFRCA